MVRPVSSRNGQQCLWTGGQGRRQGGGGQVMLEVVRDGQGVEEYDGVIGGEMFMAASLTSIPFTCTCQAKLLQYRSCPLCCDGIDTCL